MQLYLLIQTGSLPILCVNCLSWLFLKRAVFKLFCSFFCLFFFQKLLEEGKVGYLNATPFFRNAVSDEM